MMSYYKKHLTNYPKLLGTINRLLRKTVSITLFVLVGLLTSNSLTAQTNQKIRILFLFDASQSMLGKWNSNRKIDVATRLLNEIVDTLKSKKNVEVALRVYGHQSSVPPQDCEDTKLEVPFGANNHNKIKDFLTNVVPRGTTPIAYSLEKAGGDFPRGDGAKNVIILITDGKEECKGDPCAISRVLQMNGVTLKPFVIGIGLDNTIRTSLKCVGKFYDATTEESFIDILKIVITQILNPTTAQVNLLDINNKAIETNVAYTLYDQETGNIVYDYVHTMNDAGNPDTLYLDNGITYRLKVHTIPPVEKSDIKITTGVHNTIAVNAPRGLLHLKVNGTNQYGSLKCIVRKAGETNTLHVMDFGATERFIVGKYDLEILSTPRIHVKGVQINQSTTTNVEIEEPGLLNLQMGFNGYGSIFKINGNDLEFVMNVNEGSSQQSIVMQPGNYKVIFRNRNYKETILTKDKNFTISGGASIVVSLKF